MAQSETVRPLDVVIVGAGLGGLYALHKLRGLGMTVRVFEAGSGIGGTWFWNRYPGARCDIESMEYSYSFSDELQQEWKWPERYGTSPRSCATSSMSPTASTCAAISSSTPASPKRASIRTPTCGPCGPRREAVQARFCVMATGNLSTPRVPDFKGIHDFKGDWYHSGLWPADGVDFTGKRVAVVGTGSSAIQMIPLIAQQASHLYVFQRTANFSLPAQNRPMDRQYEQSFKQSYPQRRQEARQTGFGVSGYPVPTQSALEVSAEERRQKYEALWARGGSIGFLSCYSDFLVNPEANETAAEFVRDKIRGLVRDPAVAELLTPRDHPIGTKRLCLDSGYYETYNRDNVTLVDARSAPIQEITPAGIRTSEREYAVDAIAFATGFDAMTGALREIDIRVEGGPALADSWQGGPQTYLGLTVPGFPNLFIITGPGSPGVKSQMIHSIEQHTDWVADCLAHLRDHGLSRIEARPDAGEEWVAHVNEVANSTLYPLANSWYVGANIPGKPRIFMPYVAGVGVYRQKCDQVAAAGYEGFELSR